MQSESWLKPFHACLEELRQAPATLEPRKGPNIKGVRRQEAQAELKAELELTKHKAEATKSLEFNQELEAQLK